MPKNVNNQYIRSKYWCCVLEKNIKLENNSCELTQEFISKQLKYICRDYFGILHNMEDTRDHYHVVIIFENVISVSSGLIGNPLPNLSKISAPNAFRATGEDL